MAPAIAPHMSVPVNQLCSQTDDRSISSDIRSGDVIKYLVEREPLNLVADISRFVDRYLAETRHSTSVRFFSSIARPRFDFPTGFAARVSRDGEADGGIRGSASVLVSATNGASN